MTIQNTVWALSLLGISSVALIFIFIIGQAGKPATAEETRRAALTARAVQARFFGILIVGLVAGTWLTLRHFPIPRQDAPLQADQVVDVEGFMWGWNIQPARIEAGQTVEFRVTSKDVNHGFAIYAPDGGLVAQTQAMPGFTNKLLYRFEEAGAYTVQCLEYCAVGHGFMKVALTVDAAAGDQ